MAKLEYYRQQTLPQNRSNPNVRAIGAIGANWERVANNVEDAARVLNKRAQQREEDEAAIDASTRMTELRRKWMEYEVGKRDEAVATGDLEGYAGRMSEEFERQAAEVARSARTPAAQAWMTARLGDMALSVYGNGLEFERDAKFRRDGAKFDEAVENARVMLDVDPTQFETVREDLMLSVSRLPPGPERDAVWAKAQRTLALQAAVSATRDNPGAVLEAINAGEDTGVQFIDSLDAQSRLQIRALAESEIDRKRVEAERLQREAKDATTAGMFEYLKESKGDLIGWIAENPDEWAAMDVIERGRANDAAGISATGGDVPTDWVLYNKLINNPELLKVTNIGAIPDSFNSAQRNELIKLQADILSDPVLEQNLLANNRYVEELLTEYGTKKYDDEEIGQFKSFLQQAIDQEIMLTGKQLTQQRIGELADDLLTDIVVGRKWFGYGPTDNRKKFMLDIPEADAKRIGAALEASLIPPTAYNILQVYAQEQANKPAESPAEVPQEGTPGPWRQWGGDQ